MDLEIETSLLSSSYIKEYLSSMYNIGDIIHCELLQSSISDTYQIDTSNERYILKIYKHNCKTSSDIQFEIDFVTYLKSNGLDVSNYILTVEGLFILTINAPEGIRYGVLTAFANGDELDYKNEQDAFLYGVNVARIHKISKYFELQKNIKEINIISMLQTSSIAINSFLKNHPHKKNYFKYMIDLLIDKAHSIDIDSLEKIICHGDLHGGNAHRHLNNITFFDFDFCGYGPTGYDLSVFRWGCIIGNRIPMWKEFIRGYKTVKNLEDKELKNSLFFVAVRDIFIMSLYLNRISWMGKMFISEYYIHNRINFLKKIEIELQ